jgi:hypothetical protein
MCGRTYLLPWQYNIAPMNPLPTTILVKDLPQKTVSETDLKALTDLIFPPRATEASK